MNHTLSILKKHWLSLLGLNSILLAATVYAATVYADKSSPPIWTAYAQVNIPTQGSNLNANLGTLGNFQDGGQGISREVSPLKIQSAIITSDAVLEDVLEADPNRSSYEKLNSYRGLFSVTPQAQSTILTLEAEGSNPDLALERVKTLIASYQQRLDELRHQDADTRAQFAQDELESARQNLMQVQSDLTNFRQKTGIVNIDAQTQQLIGAIGELKTQQTQVLAEAQASETEAKVAATYLNINPQQAINSLRLAENKEYQAVRDQLSQVESTLAEVRSKYTDENPQVQSLQLQRQELRSQLAQQRSVAIPGVDASSVDATLGGNGSDSRIGMINNLIGAQVTAKGLQQQAAQIQNQIDKFSTDLNFISKNQARLTELQRQFDTAEGVYKGIVAQVSETKINTFDRFPNVQVIDGPSLNPDPTAPKRELIVLGGILACIFGSLSLVLFLESRKPLLSPKDLKQVEFSVLGRISRLKHPNVSWDFETDAEIEFQRLASALSFMNLENRRLMVTSASFGEGKTTVALGMAIALVKLGFRVLVVDGDLRQGELSRRLGYARGDGEGSHLIPVYPGLDLMPALSIAKDKICEFTRGSFRQRLGLVQETGGYDYVIVDSAPVSLVSETGLMSAAVENILFVVRPGTSDRYSVLDSFDQLKRHNAQIKGLIVNGVESRTEGYRYGHKGELQEAEI